jgi:hypothetical protein
MTEPRRHVLIWVAPEFLQSSGLVRIFTEAGLFLPPTEELDQYLRSAIAAGGFAMTGTLAESRHGAGIWISPGDIPGLELMVPWQYVKSVVTAETPDSKVFGLMRDFMRSNGAGERPKERNGDPNSA